MEVSFLDLFLIALFLGNVSCKDVLDKGRCYLEKVACKYRAAQLARLSEKGCWLSFHPFIL